MLSSEIIKRVHRMQDAVKKGAFSVVDTYTVMHNGNHVAVYILKSWHTHRTPRFYTITHENGTWRCTCPDFESHGKIYPCKHVLFVQWRVI